MPVHFTHNRLNLMLKLKFKIFGSGFLIRNFDVIGVAKAFLEIKLDVCRLKKHADL